jgi:hypothetical protein
MPLCAVLDSIIDTQPFIDVKNKYLLGYSVSEIIEPMLFNNSVSDRSATLNLTEIPPLRTAPPVYKSHAGAVLMIAVILLAVILSPLTPIAVAVALPVMTVKKKRNNTKSKGPFYKYS